MMKPLGQAAGRALMTHGLNTMLPGAGTVFNAAIPGYKPPRDVASVGSAPDTTGMMGINRVEPIAGSNVMSQPGMESVRLIMNDGTEKVLENINTKAGGIGRLQQSNNFYDPNSNSIVSMPKDDGSWNFDQIDPRTGKAPPGKNGVRYGADGAGFGQFDGSESQKGSSNPLMNVTTANGAGSSGPLTGQNTSPVSGERLGNVYLPNLSYNKI